MLLCGINTDLKSDYFIENHSHMLSGNHDNATTLRLLYYPPVIEEDDNKCEMAKGRCKYSQQRCKGESIDLVPPRDVKAEKSDSDDEIEPETDGNDSDGKSSRSSRSSRSSSDDKEFVVTRCGAHCDYGTFTLLSQDSEGGLEAKLPGSSKWSRVGHLPGAILINTGEILSIWSQDRYPALLHRVVIPQQESLRSRGRHSIAFFCHPGNLIFYLSFIFLSIFYHHITSQKHDTLNEYYFVHENSLSVVTHESKRMNIFFILLIYGFFLIYR